MQKILLLLLAAVSFGPQASARELQMQREFAPSGVFSVMVPIDWTVEKGARLTAKAPNDGPALGGTAYRIESRPPFSEFSKARQQGVLNMGIYKQVGLERPLATDGGVILEYEGVWPGEKFTTYYVIACKNSGVMYVCLSMVTAKTDYSANRVQYEAILSTLEIHPPVAE